MDSRNTGRWLAVSGFVSAAGAALAATGSLTALIDPYALLRLLDILDAYPL